MLQIVKLNEININSEVDLLFAVNHWAVEHLRNKSEYEVTAKSVTNLLRTLTPHIRFLSLTSEQFVDVSKSLISPILNTYDQSAIYGHLIGNNKGEHSKRLSKYISKDAMARRKTFHSGPTK